MQKVTVPNAVLLGEVGRLVEKGDKVTLLTKGSSMLPFIAGEKDSVLLESPSELYPGLIALAQIRKGHYVLHRIMEIDGDKVVLMGDGNLHGCEVCHKDNIVAVVSRIIKKDRQIDCYGRRHLRHARVWKKLRPIRRWILAVYRRMFI